MFTVGRPHHVKAPTTAYSSLDDHYTHFFYVLGHLDAKVYGQARGTYVSERPNEPTNERVREYREVDARPCS